MPSDRTESGGSTLCGRHACQAEEGIHRRSENEFIAPEVGTLDADAPQTDAVEAAAVEIDTDAAEVVDADAAAADVVEAARMG